MHHSEDILFKDCSWGESLDYLNNIVPYTENIILVSGLPDSGKTTLKQEIINNLCGSCKIFATLGDPRATVASFMQQVHLGFGLVWDNNLPPDWEELRRAVLNIPHCNWILLIDDAEKLSWDILNSLIDLYITLSSDDSNFHLILFAKDCLVNSIKNSPLKDFFEIKFENINLKSLNLEEMTVFLTDIMQLDFDRKTLKKIYSASNGIIGKVKQLAITENKIKGAEKNMMLRNLLENIISPPFMRLIVCGFLLFIAYIVFNFTQRQYDTVEVVAKVNKEVNTSISTLELETNNLEINPNQQLQYEQIYKKLYTDLKNDLQEQLLNKLLNLEEQLNKLQQSTHILETNISQKNISNNFKNNINQHNNNYTLPKNLQLSKSAKSAKNFYVLQLMASKNEQSILNLINNHPALFAKIKYFSGKFKPKEDLWFIATYGYYNDPGSAIKDLKNLPPELRKLKPLVRDYNSVQKLIKNKDK